MWTKGVSGNPSGRPKAETTAIRRDIHKRWNEVDPEDEKKRTYGERVLGMLFLKAGSQGSIRAAEVLIEHGWGKPAQQISLDVNGDSQENMDAIWELLAGVDENDVNENPVN